MAETIDSLLVSLGLDVDEQTFQRGQSAFMGIRSAAMAAAGALGLGFSATTMVRFAGNMHSASIEAERLGATVGQLTQLDDTFRQAGASTADATAELGRMAQLLDSFRFQPGGDDFSLANMVGLDPEGIANAESVMQGYQELIRQASALPRQQRRVALESLGFGQGAQALAQAGPERMAEWMAMSERMAGVTDEMVQQSIEFNRELGRLNIGIRGLTDAVMMELIPSLMMILEPLNAFLGEEGNREDIAELISKGPMRYLWDRYGAGEGGWLRERFEGRDTPMTRDQRADQDERSNIDNRQFDQSNIDNRQFDQRRLDQRSNIDDLLDAIRQQESGGRHYDEQGNLLRSPAGALGAYQIMPGTARDPGFGVSPLASWDEETQRQFAQDYIESLLDYFDDDLAAALAAYNAGAGRVEQLMERHGADWASFLPEETRNYIPGVMGRLNMQQMDRPQASNVTINVTGTSDPLETARIVDQRVRQYVERTAEDYRTPLV